MIRLDDELLAELGVHDLPPDHRRTVLAALYEELEDRVGLRLAHMMTSRQLREFELLIDANDKQGALGWLETNFPDYKQVVNEEFGGLRLEMRASIDDIIVLSQLYAHAELAPTIRASPWTHIDGGPGGANDRA